MNETKTQVGQIRSEVHGRVFKIIIDNAAKKNSFSPQMMAQMSDALTTLHNNDEYWVGVVCAEGSDFTAGLDMPKFFGPKAEKWGLKEGNIDVFGLEKQVPQADRTAVQGIVFTIGIEMMLAGDIVVAADDCRFCQMESKRGIAPLGGAHFRYPDAGRLGRCDVSSVPVRRVQRRAGLQDRARSGSRRSRPTDCPRNGDRDI